MYAFNILPIVLFFITHTNAEIGYDCGAQNLNSTTMMTFSLLESADCDFHDVEIKSTPMEIELLQTLEYKSVKIIQCKLYIKRVVYGCASFGHLIPIANGAQEYLHEIDHQACLRAHETGTVLYDSMHALYDIRSNSTTTRGIDFAGKANVGTFGRTCQEGVSYSDSYGSWEGVFVQGTLSISLYDSYASVNINTNTIKFPSGTVCEFNKRQCIDSEKGYTFWDIIPEEDCLKSKYDRLFRGIAHKLENPNKNNSNIIYTLNTKDTTFALEIKLPIHYCNRILLQTEHPKLFIYEKKDNQYFFDNEIRSQKVENLDIFTYVNSKFVYVEKHLRTQMESLYTDMLHQKCELERKTIRNSLSIASSAPDEFAYNIMKTPGYITKLAGEVIYIIKCLPTEIKIYHAKDCYAELPVIKNNETWFMKPKTHVLTRQGTLIPCNPIIPNMYRVDGTWIQLVPEPLKANDPALLKPATKKSWTYNNVVNLATTGIYTQNDLDKLQKHLMFPIEQTAVLNTFAGGLLGEKYDYKYMSKLLTTDIITQIAESTWQKLKDNYMSFSIASAGILMIIIIIQTIKLIVDTIIQGYTLHAIFGWSIELLGAFFTSITTLLISLAKRNSQKQQRAKYTTRSSEDMELSEIVIAPSSPQRSTQEEHIQQVYIPNTSTIQTTTIQIPENIITNTTPSKYALK